MQEQAARAAAFYNHWTPEFLERFGSTFQSGLAATSDKGAEDPHASAIYLADRAGVRDGDLILDAGCGVGGPAMAIASEFDVVIEGVTVSPVQVEIGAELIEAEGLQGKVRIRLADFHDLPFPTRHFDRVLMFEAVCYSYDLDLLITELARVLKPKGVLYIKDLFREEGQLTAEVERDLDVYHELWGCVATPTMGELGLRMRNAGFNGVWSRRMDEIRTDHFFASMLELDESGRLARTNVMEHFLVPLASFPILWGEVSGSLADRLDTGRSDASG